MSWVLPEVLSPVNHIAFASEVVNAVRDALSVYTFLGTNSEIFLLLKAVTILDAVFKHLTRLLTEGWVRLMVRFGELLPRILKKAH
jgi:hypothetical protein